MAIDFDELVLKPAIAVFGEPSAAPGTPAIAYQPADGSPVFYVDGVFDDAHVTESFEEGAPVSTTHPVLGVRLAQFPADHQPFADGDDGDQVGPIRGVIYRVIDVNPDGHGWAKLVLQRVSD